ncbi:MAG: shikimate kinase [Clostridium sp.]|nr:shikimate kinase [Acetatifactor muris]MCM1527217.1 shikimate kinase [Bacteroides sp.]MCM1562458.1 shikimate kinase [Clostridium sp.]
MSAKRKNIILIGFMGSGKTTLGIKLSYRLRRPVEDTDKMIERRQGMSISEIFEREGEEAFRRMETDLLRELADSESERIYSVGGGTPMRQENRELLQRCGTVVYLRARPETIYGRLKGDTTRPLLQCEDPEERIRGLLEERREAYESCADFIIDVDDVSAETILTEIMGKAGMAE